MRDQAHILARRAKQEGNLAEEIRGGACAQSKHAGIRRSEAVNGGGHDGERIVEQLERGRNKLILLNRIAAENGIPGALQAFP